MKYISVLFAVATLTGCASLPGKTLQPELQSEHGLASAQAFAAPAGAWPDAAWWKHYGDAQLDALIDEALAGSPSLAVADARLQRARAYQDVAHGALTPQVSAGTSVTQQKQSYNYLSPAAMTPQGWNDYGRASLDFSWELDFWGKNRAALKAATSEVIAAEADARQARLLLTTSIAAAYAELAREYAAMDTAEASRALRSKTAELFTQRFGNGLETRGSVRQAESRRASSEAEVLSLQEQIALQKNRLAALLGQGPDRALSIQRTSVDFSRSFTLPSQLGAELIGRRPDLAAARLRAEASAARIHVSRAQFYPNVNLTAFIGVQSLGLDVLTDHGSGIGSVGPAITLPIFNGGRLRAQLHGAEAEYAQSVASYDETLVRALQEVADAAVSQRALGEQLARTSESVSAAREAWQLQNDRYQGGLSNYLEVLSAEDYLLGTLRVQTDLQSRSMTLDVALNKALGGGYSLPN
ncbi:MAG TPA: efflux transporter outer membrane subunit [Steroidobacteraceae bacterium]|nr:efflux transporter outer membrane subunit [Steroidobacteraceae bacterium]